MRLSIGSVLPPPSRPLELGNEGPNARSCIILDGLTSFASHPEAFCPQGGGKGKGYSENQNSEEGEKEEARVIRCDVCFLMFS